MSEEVLRLRARVETLEAELRQTRAAFGTALADIFASFPARAAAVESGSVSVLSASPSSPHSPPPAAVDVCFGRRFDAPPRVVCWCVLRSSDGGVRALRLKPAALTATERTATIALPAEARAASSVVRATLHWTASLEAATHPRLAAALQALFASPALELTPALERELRGVIGACPGGANEADRLGQTLLHAAAFGGCGALAAWLLDRGAGVDRADGQGWTPLLAALGAERAGVARLLLRRGASVRAACERGQTALHLLARWPQYTAAQEALVREVVAAGLPVDARNDAGETPLLYACRKREMYCVPLATLLLELGADPSAADAMGTAPLHVAAASDNAPLAQMLVEAGADVRKVGPQGTPLVVAMRCRSMLVLELLAGRPASPTNADLLALVLRLLPPCELHRAMRVSRLFQRVALQISDDPAYWYGSCGCSKEVFIPYVILMRSMQRRLAQHTADLRSFAAVPAPPPTAPIEEQPREPLPRVLLAVQGSNAAGKSCFITRFCDRTYSPQASSEMEQRIARRHHMQLAYKRALATVGGRRVEIVLAEVPILAYALQTVEGCGGPGSEASHFAGESFDTFWAACSGCIVVLDTTRKDAADNARRFAWQWRAKCRAGRVDNIVLVGTKADVDHHRGKVPNTTGILALADDMQLLYVEASALDGTNVDAAVKACCDLATAHPTSDPALQSPTAASNASGSLSAAAAAADESACSLM